MGVQSDLRTYVSLSEHLSAICSVLLYVGVHKRVTNQRRLLCGEFSKCQKVMKLLFAMNAQCQSCEEEVKTDSFNTTDLITHRKSHHPGQYEEFVKIKQKKRDFE